MDNMENMESMENTELKENDLLLVISDNDKALLNAYESLGVKDYTLKKN